MTDAPSWFLRTRDTAPNWAERLSAVQELLVGGLLDAATLAEYEAETTPADKSQAVLDALANPVTVRVYDGSGAIKGEGTMASPWATRSAAVLTLAEVTTFAVLASGTPDPATWYIRFESGARWVRGSFGLAGSGAACTWSLPAWVAGQSGTLGTVTIGTPSGSAPSLIGAPSALTFTQGVGGTYDFGQHDSDPDGDAVTFSLVGTAYTGISISSAGLLTVTAAATAGLRNLTIRVTDSTGLSSDWACAVTLPGLAPSFTVAPSAVSVSAGDTIQFAATDPNPGEVLTYSLVGSAPGYSVNAASGLVAVGGGAASQSITVRATDPTGLYAQAVCAVTVAPASSGVPWTNRTGGPQWLTGAGAIFMPSGYDTWKSWLGYSADILMLYIRCTTWSQFRSGLGNSPSSYLYPMIAALPHDAPIIMSLDMYPSGEAGGNRNFASPDIWDRFNSGLYDDHYRTMAQGLKNLCAGSNGIGLDGQRREAKDFILRLGWEMNGDWYAWSIGASTASVANANVGKFKTAWQRVTNIVRQEIPGIWFDFSPNPDHVRGTSPQVYIEGFAPDPSTYNALSVSHHDNWLSSSQPTVDRNNPATWTRHQTYLDRNLNYAVSVGKKFALTEWATQFAEENPPSIYFPIATDPEWFIQKTWDFIYANRAHMAWDTYFSVSTTKIYDRTTPTKAVNAKNTFKALWT